MWSSIYLCEVALRHRFCVLLHETCSMLLKNIFVLHVCGLSWPVAFNSGCNKNFTILSWFQLLIVYGSTITISLARRSVPQRIITNSTCFFYLTLRFNVCIVWIWITFQNLHCLDMNYVSKSALFGYELRFKVCIVWIWITFQSLHCLDMNYVSKSALFGYELPFKVCIVWIWITSQNLHYLDMNYLSKSALFGYPLRFKICIVWIWITFQSLHCFGYQLRFNICIVWISLTFQTSLLMFRNILITEPVLPKPLLNFLI
jgi:hypothetical protein